MRGFFVFRKVVDLVCLPECKIEVRLLRPFAQTVLIREQKENQVLGAAVGIKGGRETPNF